jgi:hypothetical protein
LIARLMLVSVSTPGHSSEGEPRYVKTRFPKWTKFHAMTLVRAGVSRR